jgi:hypothetical protein
VNESGSMASVVFMRLKLAAMGTQSSQPPEEGGLAGSIRLCETGVDKTVNGTMVKVRGI